MNGCTITRLIDWACYLFGDAARVFARHTIIHVHLRMSASVELIERIA